MLRVPGCELVVLKVLIECSEKMLRFVFIRRPIGREMDAKRAQLGEILRRHHSVNGNLRFVLHDDALRNVLEKLFELGQEFNEILPVVHTGRVAGGQVASRGGDGRGRRLCGRAVDHHRRDCCRRLHGLGSSSRREARWYHELRWRSEHHPSTEIVEEA